jgi:indole-3-glycerol phosphate synthase
MSEVARAVSSAILKTRNERRMAILAEIKTCRHDGLDLLRGRDVGQIAAAYARGGASAISVVTGKWFGGTIDLLDQIVNMDLGLPVLRKDFIRNEKGLRESKDHGASAVLMTRQILDASRFSELVAYARELGLEPFVEVANADELAEVISGYDGLIAINNADIATRESTGAGIRRSLDMRSSDNDDKRLWVSASKVDGTEDVVKLAAAGFDGALVGTHLLVAEDPEYVTRSLVAAGRRL